MAAACAADINAMETEFTRPRSSVGVHSFNTALAATMAMAAPHPMPNAPGKATMSDGTAASDRMQKPTTPMPAAISVCRAKRFADLPMVKLPTSVPAAVSEPIAP